MSNSFINHRVLFMLICTIVLSLHNLSLPAQQVQWDIDTKTDKEEQTSDSIAAMCDEASFYLSVNQYKDALNVINKGIHLLKSEKTDKKIHFKILALKRLAMIGSDNTTNLISLDKEIISFCHRCTPGNNKAIISQLYSFYDLADYYSPLQPIYDYKLYDAIFWKEIARLSRNTPNLWREYAKSLTWLGDYNLSIQEYDTAITQYKRADKLYLQKGINNHQNDYIHQQLGWAYYEKGHWEQALNYQPNNPYFNYKAGRYDTVKHLCKELYQRAIDTGLKDISDPLIVSTFNTSVYNLSGFTFTTAINSQLPAFALALQDEELTSLCMNGILFTKSYQLYADNHLRNYIHQSNDTISKKYWHQLQHQLTRLEKHCLEGFHLTEPIYDSIANLQRSLMAHIREREDLSRHFLVQWQDVQQTLKQDDIAIEFIEIPPFDNAPRALAALTLRKEYTAPHLIRICDLDSLYILAATDISPISSLYYKLLWKPLEEEIGSAKNVYFAPTELLHILSIENLIDESCNPISEQRNYHRLISCRSLVSPNKEPFPSNNRAVLYGGLKYAMSSEALLAQSQMYRGTIDDISLQTGMEIDSIGKLLWDNGYQLSIYTGEYGNEESLKALSDQEISLLHFSTHGFYYTEEQNKKRERNLPFEKRTSDRAQSDEDKALERSGLYLSGAKLAIDGRTLPTNIEDGILTGKEIARLDLSSANLAVLSACDTGLGEISSGEGVYGLQRAFKKAGVQSILMSLWKVHDEATRLLMTEFYRNYLNGKSKTDSLKAAQKYLREYEIDGERIYSAPKYWAAFVLLDAFS